MSIPPLVCNTPPPPEQCDDDRDGEDFDMQYNLSQDDEDDGRDYNYGTYSDYIYSTSTTSNIHQDMWSSNISKKTDEKLCSNLLEEKKDTISVMPKSDSSSLNKVGFEDIILEDLNLTLEDQIDEASPEQNTNKFDTDTFTVDANKAPLTELTDVADTSENDNQFNVTQSFNEDTVLNDGSETSEKTDKHITEEPVLEENTAENFVVDAIEITMSKEEIRNEPVDDMSADDNEPISSNIPVIDQEDVIAPEIKLGDLSDDDFGEFDDFQFTSSESNPPATITYCENPWESEVSNTDFGDFTATFDAENKNLCRTTDNVDEIKLNESNKAETPIDGSDDFGDFDDFKSSSHNYTETLPINNEPSQNVPVLSLYSPDNEIQIIESINSVLSSIFTSEIMEYEAGFEGKLESSLNETWGHLVDTDVRQSYIVNWNNSLGQKSLLKALCIDSRNILFGPKWNSSMPKYAANLTVAPLQPQKPVTPTNTRNADEQNVDKTLNKETSTWTDPFTSDGQEYTYAEALLLDLEHLMATLDQMAHKHSSFKISELLTNACNPESESATVVTRPTNLDVFTNAMSPEMGNIYSTTLPVQPIRQINLPDTHIFTPTDSETPRSKTIHYDQGPAVLVPQPSEDSRQLNEITSKSEVSVQNSENDDDYWEFQDFKGNSGTSDKNAISSIQDTKTAGATNSTNLLPTSTSYETQILQPIKVEPITPALNWPNPGEVKETFDDFSEFVSNTSWTNETTNTDSQPESRLNSNLSAIGGSEILEDDFETFQSAPTFKCTPIVDTYQTTTSINHHNFSDIPQNFIDTSDISHTFNSKTDTIITPKQNLVQNELPFSNTDKLTAVKDGSEKSSPVSSSGSQNISASIMQPSIANSIATQRSQQKTGQILQPLSLESYSQINWPSPGIDLQDLSRFNPVESLQSLKTDLSGGSSKLNSPAHKDVNSRNEISDEDIWGEFVSSKPKQQQTQPKKVAVFGDDDEWTDFVSSPSVKPQNGLNTISLNVHTNLNMQKTLGANKFHSKSNQLTMDIPTLKYVTPKSSSRGLYNEKHFQNL